MKRISLAMLFLAVVVPGPSSRAVATGPQHTGIIGPPPEVSICGQGTHTLTDPCTGAKTLLVSSHLDLDLFMGLHVRVSGRDAGIECRVIDVRRLRPVVERCN